MKNYFSITIIVLFITLSAGAQKVNIGVKGGLNVFNIKNDNGVNYDARTGFHAGLIGHIHLSKDVALQPEVVYSVQGAKYTIAGIETKYNLGYINVPFMFQYMFDNGFRLEAGPQAGFLVSAKAKTGSSNSIDIMDNLKKVDFALSGGAGYVNPPTGLGVDVRYNLGLSNINDKGSVKSNNRGLQAGLFYLFDHK